MRCSDALSPSRRARLPSLGDTRPCVCLRFSLRPDAGRGPGAFGSGSSTPVFADGETQGFSGSQGTPMCLCPVLGPRRDCSVRPYASLQHGPRGGEDEGSHEQAFRGSIAGLRHALSTLRRLGRPNTTQDSLLGAWPASQAGLVTRRVPTKGFRFASYIPSSFPGLA